jgi:amino acid permease
MILIIQTPWYMNDFWQNIYRENDPKTHLNIWDVSSGFTKDLNFFKGTATLFYAYSCHIGAFPVYKELNNNVLRRIQKVFRRSLILDASFYILVGFTGYLSNPIDTPALIIERYQLFSNDYVMTIGRISFIFTLIMKIPVNYNSFRIAFLGLLGKDTNNIPNTLYINITYFIRNLVITVSTLSLSCFVGALYGDVEDYISLLGSFCAVIISFLIPGKIKLNLKAFFILKLTIIL